MKGMKFKMGDGSHWHVLSVDGDNVVAKCTSGAQVGVERPYSAKTLEQLIYQKVIAVTYDPAPPVLAAPPTAPAGTFAALLEASLPIPPAPPALSDEDTPI